ncbi:MAG TPA: hypothetical protein PLC15_07855 [Candidatus Obscuribacter sp.]|nr:hypothetical protein [Candidatus Obscuribacter sp.]MBK9276669.1 hypothetical protein [Candidatus Obscuribacter sp.]MBL8082718.1 hypothetical protein [Candidatus Obscuribacter sp.]HMW89473.1 hypothetical protein [Candidatus Obscuribacter sp.]HMX44921.1 hypothetical protein [Candidatus Obscuribacter sp.]
MDYALPSAQHTRHERVETCSKSQTSEPERAGGIARENVRTPESLKTSKHSEQKTAQAEETPAREGDKSGKQNIEAAVSGTAGAFAISSALRGAIEETGVKVETTQPVPDEAVNYKRPGGKTTCLMVKHRVALMPAKTSYWSGLSWSVPRSDWHCP